VITCEFNQGSKKNTAGIIEHDVKCGKAASMYRCQGEIASMVMPLCDYHRNFVMSHYKWSTEPTHAQSPDVG
jgi:hypothetical protein